MKYCPDISLRLEAASRLAFHHILHGRKELGKQIYENFPTMEYCKERQIWWALEKEEKLPFLRNTIKQSYEFLKSFIWLLADADVVDVETEFIAIKKIFELEELILDGNRPQTDWGDVWLNFDFAKRYALMGDYDNTFKYLKIAVDNAKAFDNRPDEEKYSAVLVGEITIKKTDFETSDTRPVAEILRDKWLLHDELDNIRDTKEFKEIINSLS